MFYTFKQNNTGGSYNLNNDNAIYIIIEANSAIEANNIALKNTSIYFDGVDRNIDCECCGDRWDKIYENDDPNSDWSEAKLEPEIYGQPVFQYLLNDKNIKNILSLLTTNQSKKEIPMVMICYLNGNKQIITFDPNLNITKTIEQITHKYITFGE